MEHTKLPSLADVSIHGPQHVPNLMDLGQDMVQYTVSVAAMDARKMDNPAKAIHDWMSALCAVQTQICPDDWYRLALAAFGYEWTPASAPKAVFFDKKSSTQYSDTLDKEMPAPVEPALPFGGWKNWKALFDGVCSLFINGLTKTTMDSITTSACPFGTEVSSILPMFTAPRVDTLAKQLSDPSTSQDTLDTMLQNMLNVMLNVMSGCLPDRSVAKVFHWEFEKLRLGKEGMLSTRTSPLMAGVTLLHMRGARSPVQIVESVSNTIEKSRSGSLVASSPVLALSPDFDHTTRNWKDISAALNGCQMEGLVNNAISIFALKESEGSENSLKGLKGSVVNFLLKAVDTTRWYELVIVALDKFGRDDAFKIGEVEGAGAEGTRTPLAGFVKYMESLIEASNATGADNEWVPYIKSAKTLYWYATHRDWQ